MFCGNCGKEVADGTKFCPGCGAKLWEEVSETATINEPVNMPESVPVYIQQAPMEKPAKKKGKKAGIIALVAVIMVCVIAVAGVFVYGTVQTKGFREKIASFEAITSDEDFFSFGRYKGEYDSLLESAKDEADHFRFWKYAEYPSEMESLKEEILKMNRAISVYRKDYEEAIKELEGETAYPLLSYEEEYLETKAELEKALNDFDENKCKKNSKKIVELKDDIIAANKKKADNAVDEAKSIRSRFQGSDAQAFEKYMINDLVTRIESESDEKQYAELYEDYEKLDDWAKKFKAATNSRETIGKYVQADVSEANKVKLYLNSYDYDSYRFTLTDFIIYEQYKGNWLECPAEDISQIEGRLTMDIVADISGSMRNDFYDMQRAIEGFVNSTHNETELGLSVIGTVYERYQEFTTNKQDIKNSVWNLECYGLTSLYQSLYSSVVYTASADGARCVVAFTDGKNEPYGTGYDYSAQDVIDVANYYQVPVYIIGIGSYVQSDELRNIAESTGGAYYNNISISNLQSVYTTIHEAQGKMYQLSYGTTVPNNVNRDIYVLYADEDQGLGVRFESELNAEVLQTAYASAGLNSTDLTAYYNDMKYLSSDDLNHLGDDLEAVQTIINIYYAKNGYCFGDTENGVKQLNKMIQLGVITENGSLDGDTVSAILKNNPVLWQNFSALFNYRYELIYKAGLEIYRDEPGISYEDFRYKVSRHFGEENEKRFDPVISAAWKALKG